MYEEVCHLISFFQFHIFIKRPRTLFQRWDKAYAININTIREMGECANREAGAPHNAPGMLSQDSANIRLHIIRGDESHRIGALAFIFQSMAQQVQEENADGSKGCALPINIWFSNGHYQSKNKMSAYNAAKYRLLLDYP